MTTVTEFLFARIAEDEALLSRGDRPRDARTQSATILVGTCRAQAECRAKRLIVGLHEGARDEWGFTGCLTCGNLADSTEGFPCPTLRALASVYGDHPDHDDEWRLESN
jgi:hypothetical protein